MVVITICFGSRGSQVRILLPRHRKPRSYSKCDSFFYKKIPPKQYNQTSIVIPKKHFPPNVYESAILLYACN